MELKKYASDIRFWIVLFFAVRLIGIVQPPLEVGHNWRQTTVAMVARNFLEVDNNIFLPRIDIAGEKTGITGMEFPLLNYLIYIVSEVFGYEHWYGRLINLIISSLGLWFFYRLLRKYFKEEHAFYSTIVLAVSVWFQFSRKMMPDTFAMSLIIMGMYYGSNYLDRKGRKNALLSLSAYVALIMLGALSKLPSGYLLVVFALFILNREIPAGRKISFAMVSVLALLPVAAWYFYWVPLLVEQYGYWHFFMGKNIGQGFGEIVGNVNQTLSRFYDTPLKFTGFAVFVFGLGMSILRKEWRVYTLFVLALLGFSIVVFKAGFTFTHHNYYIIPFVPVMALVAGYGLSAIRSSKYALILLAVISVEGIANQINDFRIKEENGRIIHLEADLDKVSGREDLILINSGEYPTPMYFAHRKGWVNTNEAIADAAYVNGLKEKGLRYIVILKRSFGTAMELEGYEVVLENEDYSIYAL